LVISIENIVAAFKEIDDAIAINAADPDIYYHRGQSKSSRTLTRYTNLSLSLSLVYYITNNLEAAAKDYRESIRLDDSFVYAHVQLGVVQYKLGSLATSRATFEKILSRFPDSADVHNYYGELLADKKKLDDALDLFTKASKLDPKAPLPYINKAALSSKDEAIRLCKKAVEGK
jgi:import receptor subunit TOM70